RRPLRRAARRGEAARRGHAHQVLRPAPGRADHRPQPRQAAAGARFRRDAAQAGEGAGAHQPQGLTLPPDPRHAPAARVRGGGEGRPHRGGQALLARTARLCLNIRTFKEPGKMIHRSSRTLGVLLGAALSLSFVGCKSKGQAQGGTTTGGEGTPTKLPPGLPGQSEAELAEPVAIIDGKTITVAELQDRINRQSPYVRARYTSLEQKKEFLDTIIRFEVLAKEAFKRGLDRDPEVVRTMKQVMIQRLMRDEFD